MLHRLQPSRAPGMGITPEPANARHILADPYPILTTLESRQPVTATLKIIAHSSPQVNSPGLTLCLQYRCLAAWRPLWPAKNVLS
jgi:hypothetical protein